MIIDEALVSASGFLRAVARLVLPVVTMLKRLPPKKLQVSPTTVRILSESEQKLVAGGISAGCSEVECPMSGRTCSKNPGCP